MTQMVITFGKSWVTEVDAALPCDTEAANRAFMSSSSGGEGVVSAGVMSSSSVEHLGAELLTPLTNSCLHSKQCRLTLERRKCSCHCA